MSAIPVINEDGKLFGMVTAGGIAENDMQAIQSPVMMKSVMGSSRSTGVRGSYTRGGAAYGDAQTEGSEQTDGEQTETISEDGAIENPTGFDAMPLIKAYKATTANTGYLDIGDVSITIAWGTMSAVYIDCDSMDCYYLNGDAKVSANNKVSMNSLYFPVLTPGETGVTLGTGVSKIDVVPRTFTV